MKLRILLTVAVAGAVFAAAAPAQQSPSIVCNQDYSNATRYIGARNSARSINGDIAVVFEPNGTSPFSSDVYYCTYNPFFQNWDAPQQLGFSPFNAAGIPGVVADEQGSIWAGWKQQMDEGGRRDYMVSKWDGVSWSIPMVAETTSSNVGVGTIDIASDGTVFNLFSVWDLGENYPANIYASWSRDDGDTWVTQNLTAEFPSPDTLPLTYLDVSLAPGADGKMYAAWEDKPRGSSWECLFCQFDGETWSTPVVATPEEDILGSLRWVDGCTPAPAAQAVYLMGPDEYPLAGYRAAIYHSDGSYGALSFFFNIRYINPVSDRDSLVADVLDWFDPASILVVDDDNRYNHETYLTSALDDGGYVYQLYDCGEDTTGVEQIPGLTDLTAHDLVIWFCGDDGSDGTDLGFWNGSDEDNIDLIDYLDGGGNLWVVGLDWLFDRYGAAPDTFQAGEFVFDRLGIASYDAQSYTDDGNQGVTMLTRVPGQNIAQLDTILWSTVGGVRQGEPSLAGDGQGHPHMVYVESNGIYHMMWDGLEWSWPVRVDAAADTISVSRPCISIGPNDVLYVTWNQETSQYPYVSNAFYATSTDLGQNWSGPVQLSQAAESDAYGASVKRITIGRKVRPEIPGVFEGGADVTWAQYNSQSALGWDIMYGRIPYVTTAVESPEHAARPERFALHQNYPNPFNASTTIRFQLAETAPVRLEIYNLIGQRVAGLVQGRLAAGHHTVRWDARDLASGVYLCRLQAGDAQQVRKMILLK